MAEEHGKQAEQSRAGNGSQVSDSMEPGPGHHGRFSFTLLVMARACAWEPAELTNLSL